MMESSATVHLSMLTSSIFSQCNCYETTNLMEYIEHVDVLSLTHPLETALGGNGRGRERDLGNV